MSFFKDQLYFIRSLLDFMKFSSHNYIIAFHNIRFLNCTFLYLSLCLVLHLRVTLEGELAVEKITVGDHAAALRGADALVDRDHARVPVPLPAHLVGIVPAL